VERGSLVRLATDFDVEIDWQPFEVDPQTPIDGLPPVRSWYEGFATMAHAFGLTQYQVPSWVPNTTRVMALAEYARAQGRLEPFRVRAMQVYWEEQWNLDDDEALGALAAEVGLDVTKALRASRSKRYADKVQRARQAALAKGVRAVPAVDFGDAGLVVGAQRDEVFVEAARRAGAKARAERRRR
jgi:predicted DsbA family dithiol-disulfide isomerase